MNSWVDDIVAFKKMLAEDGFRYKAPALISGVSGEELFAKHAVKNGFNVYGFNQDELLVEVIDGYVVNKKMRFPVQVKSLKARNAHFISYEKINPNVVYVFVRTDIARFCMMYGRSLKRREHFYKDGGGIYSESKHILQYEDNWDIFRKKP